MTLPAAATHIGAELAGEVAKARHHLYVPAVHLYSAATVATGGHRRLQLWMVLNRAVAVVGPITMRELVPAPAATV